MGDFNMNRRFALEESFQAEDGAGGFIHQWIELGRHWVSIKMISGAERAFAGGDLAATKFRVYLRAAPVGSRMRPMPNQRFREGEQVFHIEAVADYGFGGKYLECRVRQESLS